MKRKVALFLAVVILGNLVGCGKKEVDPRYEPFANMTKEEVAELYYSKSEELKKKTEAYSELQDNYEVLSGNRNLLFEETDMGDFSKRFETVNDKLEINSTLAIDDLEKCVSNGTYFITDSVQLKTSNNWYVKLSDNVVTFNNEDGITVKIECYKVSGSTVYSNDITEEKLLEWITQFYRGSTVTNSIKSGQARVGTQATGKIMINSEEYVIRAGVIEIGTEFVRYMAVYEGNVSNNIKDEVITNLLNSIKINNNNIRVDG